MFSQGNFTSIFENVPHVNAKPITLKQKAKPIGGINISKSYLIICNAEWLRKYFDKYVSWLSNEKFWLKKLFLITLIGEIQLSYSFNYDDNFGSRISISWTIFHFKLNQKKSPLKETKQMPATCNKNPVTRLTI